MKKETPDYPNDAEENLRKFFERQSEERPEEPPAPAEPDPNLVAKYVLFKETVQPKADLVYHPSCGHDVSPSFAFPDSRVVYADIDEKSIMAIKQAGFEAHCVSALEYDPGQVDILIMLNPAIPPTVPASHLAEGGFVLCNNYHDTASSLKNDDQFEFCAIIKPGSDEKIIYDTEDLDDCWREVETDEEFKKAPFTWGGASYLFAAPVVKAVTGKEENVFTEYKKILERAIAENEQKYAKLIADQPELESVLADEEDNDVIFFDFNGRQFVLPTTLPMKKGVVDDIFVFRKKGSEVETNS